MRGLDTGGDDHITKPFSIPELLARIRADCFEPMCHWKPRKCEAQVQAEIDAGGMCRFDGPLILNPIRRWHREELWAGWRQTQNRWEFGGP